MFESIIKRAFLFGFALAAGVAFFSYNAYAKPSAMKEPKIIRQQCDDELVAKYNRMVDKYKAMMRNPKGMLVNEFALRADLQDVDSMRHWYSLMTDRQQYNIWPYPNLEGKFVPSPFSVFEDQAGRARAGGIWITKEQGKYHAYQYLLVVNGYVLNNNVRVEAFNADKATAEEFAELIGLSSAELKRVEVVEREKAIEKWGYKGCNGAIVITTNGEFYDPLVVVNGKAVNLNLRKNFDPSDMTIKDYAGLLGVDPEDIKNINVSKRPAFFDGKSDSKEPGAVIEITIDKTIKTRFM